MLTAILNLYIIVLIVQIKNQIFVLQESSRERFKETKSSRKEGRGSREKISESCAGNILRLNSSNKEDGILMSTGFGWLVGCV